VCNLSQDNNNIIIFIHTAKTGGSSFWRSLASRLSNDEKLNFAIADIGHEISKDEEVIYVDNDEEATCTDNDEEVIRLKWINKSKQIVDQFCATSHDKLLLHYHSDFGQLSEIVKNALYVVTYRNPEERMQSAFRHWYKINFIQSEKNGLFFNDFFNDFFSYGIHKTLNCLGINPCVDGQQRYMDFIAQNVLFVNFDDYIKNNASKEIIKVLDFIGIEKIEAENFKETKTDKTYSFIADKAKKNIVHFENRWNKEVADEQEFINNFII